MPYSFNEYIAKLNIFKNHYIELIQLIKQEGYSYQIIFFNLNITAVLVWQVTMLPRAVKILHY